MLLIVWKKIFLKLIIIVPMAKQRVNFRLVNNGKFSLKYTSRPTHISHKKFGKNYAAIHEIELVLTLN